MRTRTARSATVVAAVALAASGLVLTAPAAQAAPVFQTSTLGTSSFAHDDAACTTSLQVEAPLTTVPVTENGPATTGSAASSVTLTAANPADVMTGSASVSGSGSVSSTGTNIKSIDYVASGPVNVTAAVSPSACDLHMFASSQLDFTFTVTTPGFLNVDISRKGPTYTEFSLASVTPNGDNYLDDSGLGFDTTTSGRRVYLAAGTYVGYIYVDVGFNSRSTAFQGTGSASIHATFTIPGSQSAAVQGKAKKYVTYPAARSCTTHSLDVSITKKKKKADQIKEVVFYINDQKVKKVKTPDKKDKFALPVADNVDSDVLSVVTLFPSKPGQKAKVHEVTASYLACTT